MPYYNPGLLHCGQILYQLSCKRSPGILEWVACPFFSRSSRPRNRTRVSCIAGWFFTNWAIRAPSYFCKCQVMLCPLPIMSIFLRGGENKLQASQARKRKYQWKGMPKQISLGKKLLYYPHSLPSMAFPLLQSQTPSAARSSEEGKTWNA